MYTQVLQLEVLKLAQLSKILFIMHYDIITWCDENYQMLHSWMFLRKACLWSQTYWNIRGVSLGLFYRVYNSIIKKKNKKPNKPKHEGTTCFINIFRITESSYKLKNSILSDSIRNNPLKTLVLILSWQKKNLALYTNDRARINPPLI